MLESRWLAFACTALLVSVTVGAGAAQEHEGHAISQSPAESEFVPVPGIPPCSTAAVQSGDPATGASILLAKAETGCIIPWHWHSPFEHLLMVSGTARVDTRSGEPITLRAGGYAQLPPKHVHRFSCTETCLFFVHSDAAFDIHYVDETGAEITPEQALKAGGAETSR